MARQSRLQRMQGPRFTAGEGGRQPEQAGPRFSFGQSSGTTNVSTSVKNMLKNINRGFTPNNILTNQNSTSTASKSDTQSGTTKAQSTTGARSTTQQSQNTTTQEQPQIPEGGQDLTTSSDLQEQIGETATQTTPEARQQRQELREAEQQFQDVQQDVQERTETRAQLQEEFNIAEFEQQINELDKQIDTKASQLKQEINQLGQQGFRAATVRGQEARARRQTAAEIEGLQAAKEAARGNLAVAQNRVERSLKQKYGDIEQRVKVAQNLIDINQNQFNRAEKRAARKRQAELAQLRTQQQRKIQKEQQALNTVSKSVQKGVLEPARAGELSEKVINGEMRPQTGVEIAGSALGEMASRQRKLELQAQRAQIQNVYSQIENRKTERLMSRLKKAQKQRQKSIEATEAAKSNLQVVQQLVSKDPTSEAVTIKHDGLSKAVGKSFEKFSSKILRSGDFLPGSDAADFIATHNQIKDSLTLDNLSKMSGVLSDSDIQILKNAATKLSLDLSEKEYVEELGRIHDKFQRVVEKNGLTQEQWQHYNDVPQEDVIEAEQMIGETEEGQPLEDSFNPADYL